MKVMEKREKRRAWDVMRGLWWHLSNRINKVRLNSEFKWYNCGHSQRECVSCIWGKHIICNCCYSTPMFSAVYSCTTAVLMRSHIPNICWRENSRSSYEGLDCSRFRTSDFRAEPLYEQDMNMQQERVVVTVNLKHSQYYWK